MGKKLITTTDVREAAQAGQTRLTALAGECIVTPMAKDEAESLGIVLDTGDGTCTTANDCAGPAIVTPSEKVIREVCERLKARLPADSPTGKLETVVREVVYAKMGEGIDLKAEAAATTTDSDQGVRFIDHQRLLGDENRPVAVDEKILVAEAIGGQSKEKLAGGYMVWEKSSFTRQVEQPEIAVVVEGELHLDVDGRTLVGKPGDMIYFPKGAVVAYNAPQHVKLACVNCI
jgi:ethanolamine utilization protein EutQ